MSHRRSCHRAATRRALRDTLLPLRTPSSSVHALRADAGSSRSSSRPGSDRVRVRDCRTRASTGYRTALPRRPDQTDCTTAAGSRCATSRRSETLDDRLEDPPWDNAARSLLPALTTAPPRPSRLETRRAWCASSCPHSPTSRSSAARPYCRPRIKAAVCHDPEVNQRFPNSLLVSGAFDYDGRTLNVAVFCEAIDPIGSHSDRLSTARAFLPGLRRCRTRAPSWHDSLRDCVEPDRGTSYCSCIIGNITRTLMTERRFCAPPAFQANGGRNGRSYQFP